MLPNGSTIVALAFIATTGIAMADEAIDVGSRSWSGSAIYEASKFEKCEARTVLQAGTELILAHDKKETWLLSLSNQKWQLPEGLSYNLSLEFDQSPSLPAKGLAASQFKLDIDLGQDRTLLTMLRGGHELRVSSGTFDERYSLEGTANVVPRLRSCAVSRLQAEQLGERRSKAAVTSWAILTQATLLSSPQAQLVFPVLVVMTAAAVSPGTPEFKVSIGTVTVETTAPATVVAPLRRTADAAREAQTRHGPPAEVSAPEPTSPPKTSEMTDERIGPFLLPASMPRVIALTGEITQGSQFLFLRALRARPDASTIMLDSVGGSVVEGLLLAHEVSARGLATFVPDDSICMSACAYVFFAGETRALDGSLGVHQIYGEDISPADAQDVLSDVLEALHDFGVLQEVITLMLRTRPEDIHIFTVDEIARFGLNRGMLDRAALFEKVPNPPVTVIEKAGSLADLGL